MSPSPILSGAEGSAALLSCSWEALAAGRGSRLQTLLLVQPGEGWKKAVCRRQGYTWESLTLSSFLPVCADAFEFTAALVGSVTAGE